MLERRVLNLFKHATGGSLRHNPRPKKKKCLFPICCSKKLGSVGRLFILFYYLFFFKFILMLMQGTLQYVITNFLVPMPYVDTLYHHPPCLKSFSASTVIPNTAPFATNFWAVFFFWRGNLPMGFIEINMTLPFIHYKAN